MPPGADSTPEKARFVAPDSPSPPARGRLPGMDFKTLLQPGGDPYKVIAYALAVTSAQREPSLPDVPTVAETVPGYEATAWFGIGMPKGTPKEIVEKVNAEVNRALADPKMRAKLAEIGGTPIPGTPEDFGRVVASEVEKWSKVVNASGAKVE